MGNEMSTSDVMGDDWSNDDFDDFEEAGERVNDLRLESIVNSSREVKEQLEHAELIFDKKKAQINARLDKICEVPKGTFDKINVEKWDTDPGISKKQKEAISKKLNKIGTSAHKKILSDTKDLIEKLGGDPNKLFEVDENGNPKTAEDAEKEKNAKKTFEEKYGMSKGRALFDILKGLAAIGSPIGGYFAYKKLESMGDHIGCSFAKSDSGCYGVNPKNQDQEKIQFKTSYIQQCSYNKLCGGCDKGTPTSDIQKCCSGSTDADCEQAGSDGSCTQGAHAGWSYTAKCESGAQGLAGIFGNLGGLFDKAGLWVLYVIGGIIAAIIGFMAIKFLLSHLKMGEDNDNSSSSG